MKLIPCFGATLGLLLFAVSASAQDDHAEPAQSIPRIEIAAGYSSVHDLDFHRPIPGGWFISADRNVNEWVSVTYDLSASGTATRHLAYLPGIDSHWSTGAVLIGPTFSDRQNGRLVVFGRLLGGIAEAGSSDDGYAAALAIQPGAGFDVYFNHHVGVRATADYRAVFGIGTASGERASQLWLRTGVVVMFGSR